MSVINTNVKSLVAADAINSNNNRLSTAMQRLSTGLRVNGAKDDAAGLAIGTRMDAQVRGLNMAIKNANDGVSLLQTAEGAMGEVTSALQRMRELAVQAATDTNTSLDRVSLNNEFKQLQTEIDRIAAKTQFNGMNLLDGSFRSKELQIGDKAGNTMEISVNGVSSASLGSSAITGQGTVVSDRVSSSSLAQSSGQYVKINGVTINTVTAALNNPNNAVLDVADVVAAINTSNAGVTASSYNEVVANKVGTGVNATAGEVNITVKNVGTGQATNIVIGKTNSLQEFVDAVNAQGGEATVQAKINDEGKLVLYNNSGSSIYVYDNSKAVSGSYDTATGFANVASTTAGSYLATDSTKWGTQYTGFLKLSSNTGEKITISDTNTNLAATEVSRWGLNQVSNEGAVIGKPVTALTAGTYISSGTLVINGVDIWDANNPTDVGSNAAANYEVAAANNMVALINKFSEKFRE